MHQLVSVSRHEVPANPLDRPFPLGRVLVVDDDRDMRHAVMGHLNAHRCHAVGCGIRDVPHHLRHDQFSLIVLDVQSGPPDRFAVLRQIRDRSPVPVILVACRRCNDADRIVALELGADDCLIKPFDPRELLARAAAILRRQEMGRQLTTRPVRGGYRFNGWELRRRTRRLTDPSGRAVDLTKGGYALLVAFLEAPLRPLSREQLLSATRTHQDVFDRSIDVQVLRLRRKLEPDPAQPRLIRTERGIGYVFDAAVETVF